MPVTQYDHWRVKGDDDTVFSVIMSAHMTENECDEEMKSKMQHDEETELANPIPVIPNFYPHCP